MPPSSPPSFLPRSAATTMTRLPSRYRRRSRSRSPSKGRRRSRSRSRSPSKARHRSRSPPASKVRRRSRSLSLTKVRCRSGSPTPSNVLRRSGSPPPSKVLRRSRSPPYDTTQRLAELQRAKRPSADAALDGREEEDMAGQSPLDEALVESRPSRSHCSCKHSETSSAAVEKRPDPAIRGDKQELHSEKINGKNQSDHKAPSRTARRKKMQRQVRTEAKKQMREMKRDKLLENIKKLQDRVWLLEKDGADKAEIMEFRSLLESTKKQYEENEEVLAQAGSSASKQVLNNRLEKRHVETMAAPVEKIEGDEQNMDNGGVEGTSLKSCKHLETSSAAVEKRPDPATRGEDQELHSEKMDAKNQSDHKALSRNARRKKMKRQLRREAKNQMREHLETSSAAVEKKPDPATRGEEELHSEKMNAKNQSDHKPPSRSARRMKMRRQLWTEAKKQIMEMKKDKLLEKIKKLQDCVWLLEKDGADSDEIREFRSLLESTKKQYEENEELLAQAGSSASQQVLNSDILEKTHVETMTAPVEKVERDAQNMDSGEADGRSLKGCEAVSEQNDLAEEVDRLKSEIETVRQDRDYQSAQVQSLIADMAKQKEVVRRYGAELEDVMRRVAGLEEGGLLQSEMIRTLQVQLASANEKLTVPSSTRD